MSPFRNRKLAIGLAAGYLLFVLLVSSPLLLDAVVNGCRGGIHSAAAMSLLFTLVCTLPLSWLSFVAMDAYSATDEPARCLIFIAVAGASALVNASVIYMFVSLLTQWFQRIAKSRGDSAN